VIPQADVESVEAAFAARDYRRAQSLLENLLSRFPGDARIKNKLAHTHLRLGEIDKARLHFTQAATNLEDALVPIYTGLAELEGHADNLQASRAWGRRSIQLHDARVKAASR
jgi:tetratricopeptide (TPR) repeat protein